MPRDRRARHWRDGLGGPEAGTVLPGGDAADFEDLAIRQSGDEAGLAVEGERAVAARGQLQRAGATPETDIIRKRIKFIFRRGRHADGDEDSAYLRVFSMCALKVVNCAPQSLSVSASQSLRSAMPPSFSV